MLKQSRIILRGKEIYVARCLNSLNRCDPNLNKLTTFNTLNLEPELIKRQGMTKKL